MPIPIKHLFGEDNNPLIHKVPDEKDVSEMSKGWPNLPVKLEDFPNIDPPEPESEEHKKDLRILKAYFFRPINSEKFLELSDEKPFQLLKKYVNDNNLDVDLEKLDRLNEELASLVCNLKFKYNRPRPREYMERHHSDFPYNKIKPNKTPSYPSGHTVHAFFNACMISHLFPSHEMRLRTLAEMIAQSRIDLGKHYPSDISFGRYIGEYVAKCVKDRLDKELNINENNVKVGNGKNPRRYLVKCARKHNQKNLGTTYTDELCEFLIRSNQIERYTVDINDAYDASKNYMNGLPIKYCTNNKYIRSHLNALDKALCLSPIDSPKKVLEVHGALGDDVLERGSCGVFRDFKHFARSTGYPYSEPNDIINDVSNWSQSKDEPFQRHIVYECIHPFSDGNGRSGRIILAADLNFDIAQLNDLIGNNYINALVEYQIESGDIK